MWAICFLPLLVLFVADPNRPDHLLSKLLLWAAIVVLAGLPVLGLVALVCRNVDKVEGASRGFLCGLAPVAGILAWMILAEPGLAAAGAVTFAGFYTVPGVVGSTIAGLIFSGQNKISDHSEE
jgi:hypothetical protein